MREWCSFDVTRYPPVRPGVLDIASIRFDDPRKRWEFAIGSGEEAGAYAMGEGHTGEDDNVLLRNWIS